jgi:hypothetical protein
LYAHFKGTRVQSKIDNRYYLVRNVNPEYNQKTADMLAVLNKRMLKLIEHLKTTDNKDYQVNVDLLISRYNPDDIMENILQVDTSFVTDKLHMEICVDDRKEEPKLEDINTLVFVVVHEMSHMASITYSHNAEFNKNFTFLLKKAIEIGIYTYVDYSKFPVTYCGMELTSTVI